jgi:broad specificity phosphatase PhoE
MTIFLIRHGKKETGKWFNPALRHQDPPLSAEGLEESNRLMEYFEGTTLSAIFVSQYLRTQQTARALGEERRLAPMIDPRINELDNGDLDDMPEAEFAKQYPDIWTSYAARTADFRFPGGETGEEARKRVSAFLEEQRDRHRGENIVVIAHDGIIRVGMTYLLGVPVFHRGDFRVNTLGITEIEYQDDVRRWKLIRFNQGLI